MLNYMKPLSLVKIAGLLMERVSVFKACSLLSTLKMEAADPRETSLSI
jgi:hypothetical protein